MYLALGNKKFRRTTPMAALDLRVYMCQLTCRIWQIWHILCHALCLVIAVQEPVWFFICDRLHLAHARISLSSGECVDLLFISEYCLPLQIRWLVQSHSTQEAWEYSLYYCFHNHAHDNFQLEWTSGIFWTSMIFIKLRTTKYFSNIKGKWRKKFKNDQSIFGSCWVTLFHSDMEH